MSGICPKCGRGTADGAVICPGCDFILDTSFLGDDILDGQKEQRPGKGGADLGPSGAVRSDTVAMAAAPGPSVPSVEELNSLGSQYGDALILGDLDDELASFEGADTGLVQGEVTHARIYIGGATQAILNPEAVPIAGGGLTEASLKFTPFERHLLEFVDGRKSVKAIQKVSGLADKDFFTAMALLADKGFIRVAPRVSLADEEPLFDDGDDEGPGTVVAAGPPPSMLDDLGNDVGEVFASSAEESVTGGQPVGALAFADSLASENLSDPIDDAPTDPDDPSSDGGAKATRKKRRKKNRRPPPLPSAAAPESPGSATGDAVELTTGDVFASVSDSVHDVPTDTGQAEDSDVIPSDVPTGEQPADVNSLPTQPPSMQGPAPMNAVDISLASIEAPAFESEEDSDGWVPPLPGAEDDLSYGPTANLPEAGAPGPTLEIDEGTEVLPDEPAPAPPAAAQVSPAPEPPPDEAPELTFEMRHKADKLFENAVKDMQAGRLSSAIMNAKLALHYNPGYQECIDALKEWEAAPAQKRTAPDRERILVEAAQDAESRGQYNEAIEMLDEALNISPNVAAIHNLKGVILATRLKRYREASACLMKAVDLAPGNTTYKNNLGKVVVKEELAGSQEGGPSKRKKRKKGKKGKEEAIVIKKLRPKFF